MGFLLLNFFRVKLASLLEIVAYRKEDNRWLVSLDRVIYSPHAVVVLAEMVTQMDRVDRAHGLVEGLNDIWAADLVYDHVEFVLKSQRLQLMLAAPGGVLPHFLAVFVQRILRLVFQLFHERSELILMGPDIVHSISSVFLVAVLFALEVVGDCSEQAVAVASDSLQFEPLFPELPLKPIDVLLFIDFIIAQLFVIL